MRRELPNTNNPPTADTNGHINQQHGNPRPVSNKDPSEIRMCNSFLHCRQDNLISPSAEKDVMRYTIGIWDSNPLVSGVCPGGRLTSTNVSLSNDVYVSYTDVPAGPEHFSVSFDKVGPVYLAKDLSVAMANTNIPTNNSTDVLAGSTCSSAARAHIDPARCAKGLSDPTDNFNTFKHHNYPNDPTHSGNISAPPGFTQYSTAN